MNVIFFEENRAQFLPLTFTRPIADLRIGILTIREKWEKMLNVKTSTKTVEYLSKKYPAQLTSNANTIWINSCFFPNETLIAEINALQQGETLLFSGSIIAANTPQLELSATENYTKKTTHSTPLFITKITDIFTKNEAAIQADFDLITKGRISQPLSKTNTLLGNNIFVEEGAKVEAAILNSTTGPIYIGKDAEIMEGSVVRGPFALCEHATLKLSTKIYGATTVGPYSKVGGEVTNSVILGYSNKGHDGFLGNSVLGEWCNLGADTNNSNLKNNYAEVKLWNYATDKMEPTGLQFCGLIMGDHSKCGINTMFNTGTVVGVSANVFGGNFPPNFIPSFSWGGASGFETYQINKAFEVATQVMERRNVSFTEIDKEILTSVFQLTSHYRK
ncbi:MAG: GlmU family protein [Flavobacteriales bacterium]|nr:GlmU family protein [Flavobacteriales bacterium]